MFGINSSCPYRVCLGPLHVHAVPRRPPVSADGRASTCGRRRPAGSSRRRPERTRSRSRGPPRRHCPTCLWSSAEAASAAASRRTGDCGSLETGAARPGNGGRPGRGGRAGSGGTGSGPRRRRWPSTGSSPSTGRTTVPVLLWSHSDWWCCELTVQVSQYFYDHTVTGDVVNLLYKCPSTSMITQWLVMQWTYCTSVPVLLWSHSDWWCSELTVQVSQYFYDHTVTGDAVNLLYKCPSTSMITQWLVV